MNPMFPSSGSVRSRRGRAAAAAAAAAVALAADLWVPGTDGLTLPLYVGAVLLAATCAGAALAVTVAGVCIVALIGAHGARLDAAALIGASVLLLGAALVGRVVDRLRRREARLEQMVAALRRESREIEGDAAPEPAPEPAPPRPAVDAGGRPHTGNLPRLLYRYARLLNVADEDAIYTGLALTLEEVLPAQRVAVYALGPAGSRFVAGDPLPAPPMSVAAEGTGPIFTADDEPDIVYARVRQGADGPVTAVLVIRQPGVVSRPNALKLLATFVDWASASVGHTRALAQLDIDDRAARSRAARERGRAAARTFAATGSLPLLPTDDRVGDPRDAASAARAPRPERLSIFRQDRPPPPRAEVSDTDDTERISPQAIIGAFADELSERASSGALPFEPRGPLVPRGVASHRPTIEQPAGRTPAFGLDIDPDTRLIAPPSGRPPDAAGGRPSPASAILEPPLDSGPAADYIDGDVRAAIERMARRLASGPPSMPASGDVPGALPAAEVEGMHHGHIDDDMVAAEELPLIVGPGLGVAAELGRSPVKLRFAHLLADLSDHLDSEGDAHR